MFSETNCMEKKLSSFGETNRVSKYILSVQKICCSYYQYKKARVRIIIPSLY